MKNNVHPIRPNDSRIVVANYSVSLGARIRRKLNTIIFENAIYNVVVFFARATGRVLSTILLIFRPAIFFIFQSGAAFGFIGFVVCLINPPKLADTTYAFGVVTLASIIVLLSYDWLLFKLLGGNVITTIH